MTQVGRAADWTVAAAAVLSGQHPKKSKKNATQFSGRRSNYAHLGRANMPRVCKNNAKWAPIPEWRPQVSGTGVL